MTRFAWLQSRTQTLVAAGLIAAIAVTAAVTGVQLSHLFHRDVAHCTSGCGFAIEQFLGRDSFLEHTLDILARAVPALLGLFWGAPLLAREFETGTYRLAWTQSVTRRRWLTVRLVVLLAVAVTATVPFAALLSWWFRRFSPGQVKGIGDGDTYTRMEPQVFDFTGLAPIGYTLLALALGITAGVLLRRTLVAMAVTVAVWLPLRLWVESIRGHLLAPLHATFPLGPTPAI